MNTKLERSKCTTKTYRVHEVYKLFLEACFEVYCNKSSLLLNLIKAGKNFDVEKLESIPALNKFPLLEKMIKKLEELEKPIEELRTLTKHPKTNELLIKFYEHFGKDVVNSVLIQTRIFPAYKEFVEKFSAERLGEVLELAIVNFINSTTDFEYELIKYQAELLIDKALVEKYSLNKLPFATHTVYVYHDSEHIYKLDSDFELYQVNEMKIHSPKYPNIVLYKNDFDLWKHQLLNPKNVYSLDAKTVQLYKKIGFISENEF